MVAVAPLFQYPLPRWLYNVGRWTHWFIQRVIEFGRAYSHTRSQRQTKCVGFKMARQIKNTGQPILWLWSTQCNCTPLGEQSDYAKMDGCLSLHFKGRQISMGSLLLWRVGLVVWMQKFVNVSWASSEVQRLDRSVLKLSWNTRYEYQYKKAYCEVSASVLIPAVSTLEEIITNNCDGKGLISLTENQLPSDSNEFSLSNLTDWRSDLKAQGRTWTRSTGILTHKHPTII